MTIVTVLALLGLSVGSYFGGLMLPKFGSRKLILIANIVSLVFNILKLYLNTVTIMIARLVFGFCMGITCVCLSKAINDTVPAKDSAIYGAFVNAGFAIGITLSNCMGMLIPLDNGEEGDIQKMKDDENWRLLFGVPIILEIYTILALLYIFK